MRNLRFYKLHPDNNLPNIENIYYIYYIGKGIDVEKSRFRLTKTLKMNIMKHSKKGQIYRYNRLGQLRLLRFYTSHSFNKLVKQNERYSGIAFSGHQNIESDILNHSTKCTKLANPSKVLIRHVCTIARLF